MKKINFKNFKKGMGIQVAIPGDLNKNDKQKFRPGIVIKSYPSHIKVQLLSSQPNKNDYHQIIINNKISYLRPIYYKTISLNEIKGIWYENGKRIFLDPKSKVFEKVAEIEFKEICNQTIYEKIKEEYYELLDKQLKEIEIEYQAEKEQEELEY